MIDVFAVVITIVIVIGSRDSSSGRARVMVGVRDGVRVNIIVGRIRVVVVVVVRLVAWINRPDDGVVGIGSIGFPP